MIHDTWYMIHDTWYIIHNTLYMIHDTWYMIHTKDTWYMTLDKWWWWCQYIYCWTFLIITLMMMLDLWPQAETPGVTHFGALDWVLCSLSPKSAFFLTPSLLWWWCDDNDSTFDVWDQRRKLLHMARQFLMFGCHTNTRGKRRMSYIRSLHNKTSKYHIWSN